MTRGQLRDAKGRWMHTGLSFALRCLRSGRDRARMWALHLQAGGEYEGKPKNRGERRMAEGKRRATLMGSDILVLLEDLQLQTITFGGRLDILSHAVHDMLKTSSLLDGRSVEGSEGGRWCEGSWREWKDGGDCWEGKVLWLVKFKRG